MKVFKSLRVKILILAVLLGAMAHLSWSAPDTKACQKCVTLSGGLCVGCTSGNPNGHTGCTPDQSTCTCNVTPGDCTGGGPAPEDPPQN